MMPQYSNREARIHCMGQSLYHAYTLQIASYINYNGIVPDVFNHSARPLYSHRAFNMQTLLLPIQILKKKKWSGYATRLYEQV